MKLSYRYLCIIKQSSHGVQVLGKGAFGTVFLAEDGAKQAFACKSISKAKLITEARPDQHSSFILALHAHVDRVHISCQAQSTQQLKGRSCTWQSNTLCMARAVEVSPS